MVEDGMKLKWRGLRSRGYVFKNWLFILCIVPGVILVFYCIILFGFDNKYYFGCPVDSPRECENPYYAPFGQEIPFEFEPYREMKYIPRGVSIGNEESGLINNTFYALIGGFILALCLNHLAWNRNFKWRD